MINENKSTESAMLDIGKMFDPSGGYALVCAYENRNLFRNTDMRGKSVLEIGCGVLPACFGISDDMMPMTYVATDTTREVVDAAKSFDARPQYLVESALEPSFMPGSFDVIVLRGVLHHLQHPTAALAKFRSLLRDGGELLLYEPNLACIHANIIKWLLWRLLKIDMEESPYGQLPYKTIHRAIRDSGFDMKNEWYTSLLAFQLTGDYGRRPILPDSRPLFRLITHIDQVASKLLHFIPVLAKRTHFRAIFLIKNPIRSVQGI